MADKYKISEIPPMIQDIWMRWEIDAVLAVIEREICEQMI